MSSRVKWLALALIPLAAIAAYKHRAMFVGAATGLSSAQAQVGGGSGSRPSSGDASESGSTPVRRPGSVDIDKEYDLSGLTIPKDQIHTLLPRDAIPALTNPKTEAAAGANWLPEDARIVEVVVGNDVLGVPLRVLDWHEVVNTTLGGEPIAVTYCPLCDSATVFSREVRPEVGKSVVLEFGVSGALYNSNVLMYDRKHKGLWSQLGMHAVSGPLAGTALDMLPVEVVSFAAFKEAHPGADIVSKDTGHARDYTGSPYESYFRNDSLLVPVAGVGEALPRKTLGVGVATDDDAWFVPTQAIGEAFTLETPLGAVALARSDAGVAVTRAPDGVRTAQTFYYSWSAFYPETRVVKGQEEGAENPPDVPGLSVGDRAPDVTLTTIDEKTVQLASLYPKGPVVLTFYRGGWCPFCNSALAGWQATLDDLEAAGGLFVAVSPEKPDLAATTIQKHHLGYTVLSDTDLEAARAFKVHFVVDEATKAKYTQLGLNVGESNASGTWELPAPATFVIDRQGIIRYAFADWDYTKRADPDAVIDVVRSLAHNKGE